MANSTTVDNDENGDNTLEIKHKFLEICKSLKIDSKIQDEAWKDFCNIRANVTLEGNDLHWLACSLYVSIQKLMMSKETSNTCGSYVPLSKLLCSVKLSLIHFFQKMRKWLDMGRHGAALHKKVEQLERNFSVSSIVFEKFCAVFKKIFKQNHTEYIKKGRKKQAITSKDILNFCWTLYIRTKTQYPDVTDDLVNSYHLLLCCLDMVFLNIVALKTLKTFIDPDFSGAPKNYLKEDLPHSDLFSIIDVMCQLFEGLPMETKIIKRQYLGSFIEDLIKNEKLKVTGEARTNLLYNSNLEYNMKYLNDSYEEHILQTGDFDERIFIKDDSENQIGTPNKRITAFTESDERERSLVKRNLQEHFNKVKGFAPQTPLTGRQWLQAREETGQLNGTSITKKISWLIELLKGLKPCPTENLQLLFQTFKKNPEQKIKNELDTLSSTFLTEYTKPTKGSSQYTNTEFARTRLNFGKMLFYKTLEDFLEIEKKRGGIDLSMLFEQDIFVKSLLCCSLEVVIYSYSTSTRVFPWLLKVFKLKPYHFFKIIELVIRGEELSRDAIKHLSRIEEQILESMSWESNSPIYTAISTHGVPRCQDVSSESNIITPLIFMSPNTLRMGKDSIPKSPLLSLSQKPSTPSSPARRNLFGNTTPSKSDTITSLPTTPSACASASTTTTPTSATTSAVQNNKQSTAVVLPPKSAGNPSPLSSVRFPIMLTSPGSSPVRLFAVTQQRGSPARPGLIRIQPSPSKSATSKKFGSLGIFFRKLYHLSSVRLKDLCEKLEIGSDLQTKIWTCFEHSLVENIDIMRDRHVDQLLMCAVYVMAKVTKEDKSFHEIMKFYRTQPQANKDVYRNVLIERAEEKSVKEEESSTDDENRESNNAKNDGEQENKATSYVPEPKNTADVNATVEETATIKREQQDTDVEMKDVAGNHESSEDSRDSEVGNDKNVYKDLIQFYNIIYIRKIKDFALKFASNKVNLDAPPLSPLPQSRKQTYSPRKVSKKHEIYISPIKPSVQMTPRSKMLYCFDSDSPKKLEEINRMIKGGTRRRVDLDADLETGPSVAKKPMNGLAKRAQELRQEQLSHRGLIGQK